MVFVGIVLLVRPSFSLARAVVLHFSLVALVTMVLLAIPSWTWPDRSSGLYLLGAGLGGGGAQIAMTRAYSLQRATPVTALSSLGAVFTYLLALPLFAERPSGWQLAGSGVGAGGDGAGGRGECTRGPPQVSPSPAPPRYL